jgi:hypothetical protein
MDLDALLDPTLYGHLNREVDNLCGWSNFRNKSFVLCLAFTFEYRIVLTKFLLVLRFLVVILVNRLLAFDLPSSICSLGTYLLVVSLSDPRLIV